MRTMHWTMGMAVVCGLALAMPARGDDSHLKGTWRGTAQKTVCGQDAGGVDVMLVLKDEGYQPLKSEPAMGDVSGDLFIGGTRDGLATMKYDGRNAKATSFPGSVKSDDGLSLSKISIFATYWLDLQAADPYAGLGIFQTLKGQLKRRNSGCMNLGDTGEVLKVTLKKQ